MVFDVGHNTYNVYNNFANNIYLHLFNELYDILEATEKIYDARPSLEHSNTKTKITEHYQLTVKGITQQKHYHV